MPKIKAATVSEHKDMLADALLREFDALLDERDFVCISLADVAARAGIARSTVYNYYEDKWELLARSIERSSVGLMDSLRLLATQRDVSPAQRLADLIHALMMGLASRSRHLLLFTEHSRSRESLKREQAFRPFFDVKVIIADVLSEGIQTGLFAEVADPDLIVDLVTGSLQAGIERLAGQPHDAGEVADQTANFLLRAISQT